MVSQLQHQPAPLALHHHMVQSPVPPVINHRYVVARLIGHGSQAQVFLAWDRDLQQWCALKALVFPCDAEKRSRFTSEGEILQSLSHQNLLPVWEVGNDEESGLPYIVTALARGGSLDDMLARHGALPAREAAARLLEACDGLAEAHDHGVVHRDIKPGNLLIDEDGHLMVADFGVARSMESELTETGSTLGTYAYMAPEQRYDATEADARADVYALGATLYRLVTGRASADLFFANEDPSILAAVPEPLQPVIREACRYDRDERLQSVQELREQLLAALTELPEGEDVVYPALLPLPPGAPRHLALNSGLADLKRALGNEEATVSESPCAPAPLRTLAGEVTLQLEPNEPTVLITNSDPLSSPNEPTAEGPSSASVVWRVAAGLTGIQVAWMTALAGIALA